jgi:hypothetical protein
MANVLKLTDPDALLNQVDIFIFDCDGVIWRVGDASTSFAAGECVAQGVSLTAPRTQESTLPFLTPPPILTASLFSLIIYRFIFRLNVCKNLDVG